MKTRALLAVCVGFVLATFVAPAIAQPQALINEAMDLYRRGNDTAGLQKLQEVLAAAPSSEEVWPAIQAIEFREWANAMIKGGEHQAVVQAIMNLGVPAARAKSADAEAIRGLVAKLDGGDWNERQMALNTLRADHASYAVPVLAERFDSDDTLKRAAAMEWTRRMGLSAVLPLIQIAKSENQRTASNALTILGQLGDRRALPCVAAHVASSNEILRQAAQRALAEMKAGNSDARGTAIQLAEDYYRRNPDVVSQSEATNAVWRFIDGKAVAHEVPADVYHLKLAEEVLFDALAANPGDRETRVLLTSVLIAEATAGGASEEAKALSQASVMASLEDMDILDGVVSKALADGRPDVATGAINIISGKIGSGSGDRRISPAMSQALDAPAKEVRFAAALAHAENGIHDGRVVPVLMDAVSQTSVRSVLVIDDNPDTRNRIVSDLNAKGYFAYGAPTGASGFARVREYPIEDAVIIRYNLKDTSAVEVIRLLRADERTADRPIGLLCDESELEGARAALEDKVQVIITSPPSVDAYEPQLKTALGELDSARAAATMLAARAATALAHGQPGPAAVPALMSVLKSDDSVRGPAMMALGNIGDASASSALLEVFTDSAASSAMRGEAAVAIAKIARATGSLSQDARDAIGTAIKGDGEPEFWTSLGRALGIAPLAANERHDLLSALRSRIKVDLVE